MGIEGFDYDNHLTGEIKKSLADDGIISQDEASFMVKIIQKYGRRNIKIKRKQLIELGKEFGLNYNNLSKIGPQLFKKLKERAEIISNNNNNLKQLENTVFNSETNSTVKSNKAKISSIINDNIEGISDERFHQIFNGKHNVFGGTAYSKIDNKKMKKIAENEYRKIYGKFQDLMSKFLDTPRGLNNAIIHKETNFGIGRKVKYKGRYLRILNSKNNLSSSKGISQLTKKPFEDMIGINVKKYINIFKKINLSELKNIYIGNGKTIEDTMDQEIWNDLEKIISNNISVSEFKRIIKKFQNIIKGKNNREHYNHTLNLIISNVYLSKISFIRTKAGRKIRREPRKIAEKYNGDLKHKYIYGKIVNRYYLKEKNKF